MKTVLRALVAGFVSLVLVVGAGPAQADSATRGDRLGDAAARYDLRSGTYVNNRRVFSVDVRVVDLQDVLTQFRVSFATRAMQRTNSRFEVYAKRSRGGNRTVVIYSRNGGTFDRLRCPGLRTRWELDGDRFFLRVPQFCLGEGVGRQIAYTSVGRPDREFADTVTRTVVRRG